MKGLILNTLKSKKKLFAIMLLIALVMAQIYIATFPTIEQQSKEFDEMMKTFPKELWVAFGIEDGQLSMSTFEKFLAIEYFTINWPIFVIIMMINMGIGFISGEIEAGTMTLLLANPISRTKIFFAKYLSGVILLLSFVIISIVGLYALSSLQGITLNIGLFVGIIFNAVAFVLAGFGIAILFSTIFSRSKALSLTIAFYFFMYFLNVFSGIIDQVDFLKYFSIFNYLDISRILNTSVFEIKNSLILLVISSVTVLVAHKVFEKRDISN